MAYLHIVLYFNFSLTFLPKKTNPLRIALSDHRTRSTTFSFPFT